MAFTPKDAHLIVQTLANQATGRNDIVVTDGTSFVSAGRTLLETGTENVLNTLSVLVGKSIVQAREYKGSLSIIQAIESEFTNRIRKISFYSLDTVASGDYNTDLYTSLGTGKGDADGPGSQWEQRAPEALEMNFAGSDVWQYNITRYEDQLKLAFRTEAEFIDFLNGFMTELNNDFEQHKEAFARIAVLNHITGTALMAKNEGYTESYVNLTKAFNEEYNTDYTTAEILQEHPDDFLKFYVARVAIDSKRMEMRTALYHWSPEKSDASGNKLTLLRHTPKSMQRFIYFDPMFTMAKTRVLPEIFNDSYLKMEQGEGVQFWQSVKEPSKIKFKPSIAKGEATEVVLDNVVGMLYDKDALLIDHQFDGAVSTPMNARHRYINTWYTWRRNVIDDFTENTIVYYMADEA